MSWKIIHYGNPKKAVEIATDLSLVDICLAVVGEARDLAPVKDGILEASITWKTNTAEGVPGEPEQKLSTKVRDQEGIVGTNVEYAAHQEFGTKYMAAQPYLRPAILRILKDILKMAAKEQEKQMKKESK